MAKQESSKNKDFQELMEEALKKIDNRFLLINVLSKRAHQLAKGMQGPGFDIHKAIEEALRELVEDKLDIEFKGEK